MKRFTLLLLLACVGCAAKRPQKMTSPGFLIVQTVVPPPCIVSIERTDHTECVGPDTKHLHCSGVNLEIKRGCVSVRVVKSQQ